MSINKRAIIEVIENKRTDNVICRALELRPDVLSKYICGLANRMGGYILIGVEKENGRMVVRGCLSSFDVSGVITAAKKRIEGEVELGYDFVEVQGMIILVVRVEKSAEVLLVENKYYEYKNNDIREKARDASTKPITLFISYTECDAPIVDIIESILNKKLGDKIKISRYTELQYKDSFKEFMNTIQEHDFVLTVVSDTYLKRQACMYEVGEIIKDRHYRDKLLFIVLSEQERQYFGDNASDKIAPNIYGGAEERLGYTNFWKEKYISLEKAIRDISDYEAIAEASKELQIIGQIYRKDIGEFLKFLADENGLNFQKLYQNEFEEIVTWLINN